MLQWVCGKTTVLLRENTPFPWAKTGSCAVKGCAWRDDCFYNAGELLGFVSKAQTYNKLLEFVIELNGNYSIVASINGITYAISDRMRSFPLYYTSDCRYIFDNVDAVQKCIPLNSNYDFNTMAELMASGLFSLNNKTILDDVRAIESGAVLSFAADGLGVFRYFRHMRKANYTIKTQTQYQDEIHDVSIRVFTRLIQSVEGKTVILPLSGGFDSRYVLCMLIKLGYKNIVTYTYGVKDGNYETENARKIAAKLNVPWFYVETNDEFWEDFKTPVFIEYINMAHNYTAVPHLQEVLVLSHLRKNKDFPRTGVVVTGFCGDMLGGSHIVLPEQYETLKNNNVSLTQFIFNSYFSWNKNMTAYKDAITENINKSIHVCESEEDYNAFNDANECWFTENKITKYLINSFRVYEFYGYEWRLPLWDNELTDYWYSVPNSERMYKKLYNDTLFEMLFKPFEVEFSKSHDIYVPKNDGKWVRFLKKTVMRGLNRALYYFSIKNKYLYSPCNFQRLSELFYKDTEFKGLVDKDVSEMTAVESVWFLGVLFPDAMRQFQKSIGRK